MAGRTPAAKGVAASPSTKPARGGQDAEPGYGNHDRLSLAASRSPLLGISGWIAILVGVYTPFGALIPTLTAAPPGLGLTSVQLGYLGLLTSTLALVPLLTLCLLSRSGGTRLSLVWLLTLVLLSGISHGGWLQVAQGALTIWQRVDLLSAGTFLFGLWMVLFNGWAWWRSVTPTRIARLGMTAGGYAILVEVAVRGFWDPAFAPLRGALGYSDSLRALLALQALGGLAVGLYLKRVGRYLRSGAGGSGSVRL